MVHLDFRWRTAIALAFVAMGSISLSACGSGDASTSAPGDDTSGAAAGQGSSGQYTIGVSNPLGSISTLKFWQEAIETQAKSLGMKVIAANANFEPNKQLSDVQSLAANGVDAMIVSPLDPEAIRPAVEELSEKGIPVIGYNGGEGSYATNFVEQGYEGAKAAMQTLGKAIGKGAKIAIIKGVPQVPTLAARNEGLEDAAEEMGLDVVAAEVNLQDTAENAQNIVQAWASKYGSELDGIAAFDDPSALGAASSVSGSFSPTIVAMDGSPEGIEAVENGQVIADYGQQPVQVGNGLAFAAHQILEGKQVPEEVKIAMPEYNQGNVATWESPQELLRGPLNVKFVEKGDGTFLEANK